MLDRSELAALAAFCRARGIRLIADEIYHGITYERAAPSTVLELDPDAIVINGFSKYFCMTGWRLGWLVAPPDLVRPIELLAQNLFISPPALAQEAALGRVRLPRRARCAGRDAIAAAAPPCWNACRAAGSTGSPRSTAPSTCTPTSAI